MKIYIYLILVLLSVWNIAYSQIPVKNIPLSNQFDLGKEISKIELPALNNEELVEETKDNEFYAFARNIPLRVSQADGQWEKAGEYLVWRLKISSPSAYGLKLIFDEFELAEDDRLFFHDTEGQNISSISQMNNNVTKTYTSKNLMYGEEIIIEYNCPFREDRALPFNLKSVGHIFVNNANFGWALDCHNDVNCQPQIDEWCFQIRSTVKIEMIVEEVDNRFTFFVFSCSGVLVNNVNNNYDPLILTAQHCVDPEARLGREGNFQPVQYQSWLIYYNFQNPECNSTSRGNDELTTVGVDFLLSNGGGTESECPDMALLRVVDLVNTNHPIPIQYNVFYAGVNSLDLNNNVDVTTIHHPAGDLKKISDGVRVQHYNYSNRKCWKVEFNATNGTGIIEGGSSGGPLFGPDRRVIGINHAVTPIEGSILNNDPRYCEEEQTGWHGKVQDFWSELAPFLLDDDEDIVAYTGIDPIAACQNDIEVWDDIFPALDWQPKNDLTIQATNTIEIAPNSVNTTFRTSPTNMTTINFADYTFRAGSSVRINPGFSIGRGHRMRVEIGDCESFSECGFNYPSKIAPPNDKELEAVEDVQVKSAIMIGDEGGKYSTKVYPNPTSNQITIESPQPYQLQIFNLMGQEVGQLSTEQPIKVYDMTSFENGVYIFRIQYQDGTMKSWKILKQ